MAAALVDGEDLYRFFRVGDEETRALRGVSLSVMPGEFVALAGPSGSGKSTLLACLAGLDEPSGGTVRVAGHRLTGRSEAQRAALRGRHIGMLLQHGNLLPHLTVQANVLLAQRVARRAPVSAGALLEQLGLAARRRALPSQLSGGEAARAGLAVALASGAEVLLADEPTGELDSTTEAAVLDLLRLTAMEGRAVLVVTHSPSVMEAADRVIRLDRGAVRA